ncbi:MAG: hypothetical protein RL154_790 [Pseudomonadota bacterium]|jgi:preprotein translocase subunit SecE
MNKIIQYVELARAELSKVIFPTKQQVRVSFYAVLVVVSVVTLYLSLIDWIMSSSIKAIIG